MRAAGPMGPARGGVGEPGFQTPSAVSGEGSQRRGWGSEHTPEKASPRLTTLHPNGDPASDSRQGHGRASLSWLLQLRLKGAM